MRHASRLLAFGIALVGTGFWFFGGPNLGWTKTQMPVSKQDAVTGLEYVEWQRNFVPGLDFLVATDVVAGLLFAASSYMGRRDRRDSSKT